MSDNELLRNKMACGYTIIGAAMLGYREFPVARLPSREIENGHSGYYTQRASNSRNLEDWVQGCGFRCRVRKTADCDGRSNMFELVAIMK